MASITQDMRFRLSLIQYAERHGVSNAVRKYKTNRQYIYRWKRRYDGSIESLRDRSRRPHHHPNQHTPEEIKLINDLRRLAGSKSNDAVKLAFLTQEDADRIDQLDLRGLVELRRSGNGTVEIKLIDRLKVLELLDRLSQREEDQALDGFLDGLRREEP